MSIVLFIILLTLLIVFAPLAFAYTQWDFLRNLEDTANRDYNRDWHGYQWLTLLLSVCLGYALSFFSVIYYPFVAVMLWTLSDGFQNKLKGKKFFAISDQSMNVIENFSQWYVKIPLLIVSIIIIFLIQII